ncbi:MAG TPA: TIM-barrel domain-containing protein, partial [Dehalococcoidales bacterium]|nr:TIM-barrel domain-containing protein [Dehalococcoidales bacterium]
IKDEWPAAVFGVSETPDAVSIDTGAVCFEAQRNPWKYTIHDKAGEVVLQENVRDIDCQYNYRGLPVGFTSQNGKFCRSNETFSLLHEEAFYGFGEKFTRLNKLGQRIKGWNANPYGAGTEESYKNIPFFMSTRGYGIFVNTTHRVTYSMGSQSLMTSTIMVDDPRLDIFIIYGPAIKDVLARYVGITGWPALPPKESFGIECNPGERSPTTDKVMAIARKFKELDIPVDRFSFLSNLLNWRQKTTTEEQLVWAKNISEELAKLGIKTGLYVAPLLNLGSEMEKEAREKGYALTREDGSPYEIHLGVKTAGEKGDSEYSLAMIERDDAWRDRHSRLFYGPCLMPDFTNPETVKWWKGKIIQYMKAGCDSIIMSDFGEDVPADAYYHNGRSGQEMHNLYQLLYQKASFEAVAEGTGHRGIVNARSGTAGMQRYPICWSGDPNCEWEDMLNNIRAGLSIGLSGVPFWSCDNAGFSATVGHLTPEMWIRWSQMSMFTSHTRLHGTEFRRVPWTFGDQAVENFRKYAKLRYRLLPYIYSQAYKATKTGLPMMRAMVLEFQDDPNTYSMEDQYMFGDAFLVAPVHTPVNRRTVYLPEGTWFDYYTAKEYKGPITLRVQPPLEVLPLYIRGNSIIPMGPDMAYVGEKPFDPITLDVWLCSEGECTIYDDDQIVKCRARRKEDRVVVDVSASEKTYIVKLNKTGTPSSVKLNGVELPRVGSAEELEASERGWYFAPMFVVYAKFKGLGGKCELVLRV